MIILGLNAYHGDSSACIVVDGKLLAAVEKERFTRIKHWVGFLFFIEINSGEDKIARKLGSGQVGKRETLKVRREKFRSSED